MENETSDVQGLQPKCQGPLQLLSPPFLVTSITKQMKPNGRGGRKLSAVFATKNLLELRGDECDNLN